MESRTEVFFCGSFGTQFTLVQGGPNIASYKLIPVSSVIFIPVVIVSPQDLGLWDHFQMA